MTQLPQGTVTVLLTDVEASTDMAHAHGDPSAHELLRLHRQIVRTAVARHDGHEVKTMGDGFMLAFSSARSAVICAIDIQRALDAHSRRHPGRRIRLRMGLNTGEMIRDDDDLFGSAIAAAERIMRKAKGGEVLISDSVRAVMGLATDIELRDRGRFRLKGFPQRLRLHEAVWQQGEGAEGIGIRAELERTPFVGREGECDAVRSALRRAAEGEGSVVIVSGEAGVGKTRVATHILAEAGRQGMLALMGRCREDLRGPSYAPFAEIFESVARVLPEALVRDAAGEWLGDIARVMPALGRFAPEVAPYIDVEPARQRHQILVGVASFFETASAQRPIVLLLDDLQWADEGTGELLVHLAQAIGTLPVLVIGTLREPRGGEGAPILPTLGALHRQQLAQWVTLPPFSADCVRDMLAALCGRDPPAELCQAIFNETDGNAFFVEEVFKHLAEEHQLFDAAGEWLPAVRVGEVSLPPGLKLVVELRLARLSDSARRLLRSAAVIGRTFPLGLLERVSDLPEDARIDAVDECERANLITPVSREPDSPFVFAHELVRRALVDAIGAPELQREHLRVAHALEEIDASQREGQGNNLAYHYTAAGRFAEPARVIAALRQAAAEAMTASAHADADAHYRAALRLIEAHPETPASDGASILHGFAQAQYRLGHLDESARALDGALEIYRREGMTAQVAEVLYLQAVVCTFQARALTALEHLAEAKESVPEGTHLHGLILVLEAQSLVQLRHYEEARLAIDAAETIATALSDSYVAVRARIASGYQRLSTLELRGAADDFLAVSAADRIGMHERMAATSRGALALTGLGRFDEAATASASAEGFFRKADDPYERALACLPLAMIAVAQGRFDEASALADEAMSGSGSTPSRWVTTGALPLMLQARYASGRTDEIDGIVRLLTSSDGPQRTPYVVRLAECLAAATRGDGVTLTGLFTPRGVGRAADMQSAAADVLAAEIAIATRSIDLAAEASELLRKPYERDVLFTPGWVALLPRLLGACEVLRGNLESGERLLRHALEVALRCAAKAELASTHLEFAELFALRSNSGDVASAASHVAEARRVSAELGVRTLRRRLDALERRVHG